jgi:hypothetical protein
MHLHHPSSVNNYAASMLMIELLELGGKGLDEDRCQVRVRILGKYHFIASSFPLPLLKFTINDALLHFHSSFSYTSSTSTGSKVKDHRRIPDAEDDCPICYDKMNENGIGVGGGEVEDSDKTKEEQQGAAYKQLEKILDWCVSCGNAVHKECWGTCESSSHRVLDFA